MSNHMVVEDKNRQLDSSGRNVEHAGAKSSEEPTAGGRRSRTAAARRRAAIVFIAPAVILAGLLYHPHIGNPTDADFLASLAEAVAADPTRWALAHLAIGVGSGLLIVAFIAIRSHFGELGENRWSRPALPFIVMGSTLYAMLPAMEFVPLAAADAGADIQAAQAALLPWFAPTLFTGALIFAIGAIGFAVGIFRSRILDKMPSYIVAAALIVLAISRLIPLFLFQIQLTGIAGIVALWPLAYVMWSRSSS